MRSFATAALALCLAAGCQGAPAPAAPGAPARLPSAAELALMGPARAAEHLSVLSADHDAARASAALVAADTCPATDEACRRERKAQALEAFATVGAAIEALVAVVSEIAGPQGSKPKGPDDADVYARLGLPAPAPAPH